MSRTVTTSRTVYTFDELSDSAKETARQDWSQFMWEDGSMQEGVADMFENEMQARGWEDAELRTYGLYVQGGYPTWRGTLPAFEHDGRPYVLTVTTRHSGGGSEHMSCEVEDAETTSDDVYGTPEWPAYLARIEAAERAAKDMVYSLSVELYRMIEAEDEYQSSEDMVRETAEANGYEYDEDGHLA